MHISLPQLGQTEKTYVFKFITLVFCGYVVFAACLYQHYSDLVRKEKDKLLHSYYDKLLHTSVTSFSSALSKLDINPEGTYSINISKNTLSICDSKNCTSLSLFKLGSVLNSDIPEFINYKIELNGDNIYSNSKNAGYELERKYHFSDYMQFNILVGIDVYFWKGAELKIQKPFWITSFFVGILLFLLVLVFKSALKKFNVKYKLYYQNQLNLSTSSIKEKYKSEFKKSENQLMNKIWNIEFKKQKDLELNCLFAKEANQIALVNQGIEDEEEQIKDSRLRTEADKLPCSIVLHRDKKMEEISIHEVIDLFSDRFDQEDENINVKISSNVKLIRFSSKAALYQIIYSIISYLFFLLKKQTSSTKRNIHLSIDNIKRNLQLRFEYDGVAFCNEEELEKMSSYFFKSHANPFLLNLNQIFDILRSNGFDCKINYELGSCIEIIEKRHKSAEVPLKSEDNIILLSSFIRGN